LQETTPIEIQRFGSDLGRFNIAGSFYQHRVAPSSDTVSIRCLSTAFSLSRKEREPEASHMINVINGEKVPVSPAPPRSLNGNVDLITLFPLLPPQLDY
jgi:hypothetical protein